MKRILCTIIAICCFFTVFAISSSAEENCTQEHVSNTTVITILSDVSPRTREKILEFYSENGSLITKEQNDSRGIMCSLFGHKLEYSNASVIEHRVRATSPRCLQTISSVESCTRCDYINSTVLSRQYIVCCS